MASTTMRSGHKRQDKPLFSTVRGEKKLFLRDCKNITNRRLSADIYFYMNENARERLTEDEGLVRIRFRKNEPTGQLRLAAARSPIAETNRSRSARVVYT